MTDEQIERIGRMWASRRFTCDDIRTYIAEMSSKQEPDFVPCKCESDEGKVCGRCHAWDDLVNPSDKQEAKYVETQPGSPNFDGAEAYEAYLNAQSAEQDRIDAELFQRLLHARSELGRAIADPMWADHAEVPKAMLKRWHSSIDAAIDAAVQADKETK